MANLQMREIVALGFSKSLLRDEIRVKQREIDLVETDIALEKTIMETTETEYTPEKLIAATKDFNFSLVDKTNRLLGRRHKDTGRFTWTVPEE